MSTSDADSKESYECPTCGRGFNTERGMRSHHGIKHDKPHPDRVSVCEECGDEFIGEAGKKSRFCSTDCKHDWLRDRPNTKHPDYDKKRVACEWCGEKERVAPSRAKGYQFCSRECQGKWQSATRTGENSSNWKGGVDSRQATCDCCGEDFTHKAHSKGRFCSHECYHEYHVGENHSNWCGGEVTYTGRWKRQRRKAVVRDQARCTSCGMTDREHHAVYGRSIDVHHITPYRKFDDAEEANKLSNLTTLCRGCHHKWESCAPLQPQVAGD